MKIGDRVVCVKSHTLGITVKNKIYTIQDIKICKCGKPSLYLGHPTTHRSKGSTCVCGVLARGNKWWQGYTRFRKLITDYTFTNEITKELANKPLVKETVEEEKELI